MNNDSESFDDNYSIKKYNNKDDFVSMGSDLFQGINWKVSFFLFILGVLIFSDVFIELFLVSINDAVEGDTTTTKGTMIQLFSLTLGYIIIDLLVQGEIL